MVIKEKPVQRFHLRPEVEQVPGMIVLEKNSGCLVEKVLITTATFQVGENDRFSDFL